MIRRVHYFIMTTREGLHQVGYGSDAFVFLSGVSVEYDDILIEYHSIHYI